MYLLDTNTLIYFLKGMGNVAANLLAKAPADIGISSIVLYELRIGICKSTNPETRLQALSKLTDQITVRPFDYREAGASAQIRSDLERIGTPIGPYDTLIAGTALAANATLVTHNTREFSRVKGSAYRALT